MIELTCCSAAKIEVPENAIGQQITCPDCGRILAAISGEPLADGAGSGDFDAALVADDGSALPAGRYALGGVAEISIGKSPECSVVLPGKLISRRHCKLVRVDFGPSRWQLVDEKSTNGLFVNGQRIAECELTEGDTIRIGEFGFTYHVDAADDGGDAFTSALEEVAPALQAASSPQAAFANQGRGGSNGFATAGMVLGIILCVPLCSLLAIIFSSIGLSRVKFAGRGRGQAIAGLTLGIVGLFVVTPVSCSIMLPALNAAREAANRVKCASNMKLIGLALSQYANAHQGVYPPTLDVLTQEDQLPAQALICPDLPAGQTGNYILLAAGRRLGQDAVLVCEPISNHHNGANVLYADGGVTFLPTADVQQFIDSASNFPPPAAPAIQPPTNDQGLSYQPSSAPPRPRRMTGPLVDNSESVPPGAVKTEMVGGNGGVPYLKVDGERRNVIGFLVRVGRWSGHPTIRRCDPLWTAPAAPASASETLCIAKDGYAVGGIIVTKLDGADGIQIMFMKLTPSGVDASDSYLSEQFGVPSGTTQTQLAGKGERVIGTYGRRGLNLDAIGLVVEPIPPTK
jgi:hypothetical protein